MLCRVNTAGGGSAADGSGDGSGVVGRSGTGERSKALRSDGGVRWRAGVRSVGVACGWNCEGSLASRGSFVGLTTTRGIRSSLSVHDATTRRMDCEG